MALENTISLILIPATDKTIFSVCLVLLTSTIEYTTRAITSLVSHAAHTYRLAYEWIHWIQCGTHTHTQPALFHPMHLLFCIGFYSKCGRSVSECVRIVAMVKIKPEQPLKRKRVYTTTIVRYIYELEVERKSIKNILCGQTSSKNERSKKKWRNREREAHKWRMRSNRNAILNRMDIVLSEMRNINYSTVM